MQYYHNSHKLCANVIQVPYGNSFHSHLQWDCVSVGERESRVRASCEVRAFPLSALSSYVGIGKWTQCQQQLLRSLQGDVGQHGPALYEMTHFYSHEIKWH